MCRASLSTGSCLRRWLAGVHSAGGLRRRSRADQTGSALGGPDGPGIGSVTVQNVRVDTGDWIRPRLIADPEPVVDFDTGQIKINPKTGERDYVLSVAVRREGQRRSSAIEVKVRGMQAPDVSEGEVVAFEGLIVTYWEQNGRSGLAFRADAVTRAMVPGAGSAGPAAPSRTAPSGTGAQPAPTPAAPAGGSRSAKGESA